MLDRNIMRNRQALFNSRSMHTGPCEYAAKKAMHLKRQLKTRACAQQKVHMNKMTASFCMRLQVAEVAVRSFTKSLTDSMFESLVIDRFRLSNGSRNYG